MPAHAAVENLYRARLLTQRAELLQTQGDIQKLTSGDRVKRGAAQLAHLEAAALLDAIEARLLSVNRALGRLEEGRFGLCVECGDTLPTERLEARPDAHLCVPCCERWRQTS